MIRSVEKALERVSSTTRGRNAIGNVIELWVGTAGILSGISFFYSPASIDGNALSRIIGYDVSAISVIGYMLAGFWVWYGLLRPDPRWEIAGLCLIGSATVMSGISIIEVFGMRGFITASILLSLTAAAWTRALMVNMTLNALVRAVEENPDARGG